MRSLSLLLSFLFLCFSAAAQSGPRGYVGLALGDPPGGGGAVVGMVAPGSPAQRAGVQLGDLIVALNGAAIDQAMTMVRLVGALEPGQIARLSVIRPTNSGPQRLSINITIAPPPGSPAPQSKAAQSSANSKPNTQRSPPLSTTAPTATSAPAGPLKVSGYTRLSDPLEQAFAVEVPAGWNSTGGLARRAALQINPYVRSVSPDKMIYLMVGDPNLPSFSPPTQVGNAIGNREGKFYDAGLGGLALVMHYLPGAQFARAYGETMLTGLCPGLKFTTAVDRPDLAKQADALVPTVIPSRTDGGEARFTCTHDRQEMEVRVGVATRITRDNVIWNVILLGGFIAPKSQADAAEAVLTHIGGSFMYSPAWIQKQNSLSQQAALEINRQMQNYFNQERKFIQNLNSVDENFESMDELISGFSTYHDARTGNDYSLSNTNPNKWIDDSTGRIVSTPTNAPPPWGPAFRALPLASGR